MTVRELTFPLVPRRRLTGLAFGAMHSARRGTGSDVAGSRPYGSGDDMKTIDWFASARLSSAHDQDEFIVREWFAEEAPRVTIVSDRRPEMRLFPSELPWLHKPAAVQAAGGLIADSTADARGFVGYLDLANVDHPDESERAPIFWRAPNSNREHWRVKESHLLWPHWHAPADNLTQALEHLTLVRQSMPAGSFVFVLSDFLVAPSAESWLTAVEHRWDIVPVVIQDPVWEQSFPPVGSIVVPLADPQTGRIRPVRLRAREARERKAANEERLKRLLYDFRAHDLEPILISSSDPAEILEAFLSWADHRLAGRRYRR
ncbi:MAG: DUF58 domain-containing protein [Actinobacteria bacterium]|nr:MAG: DUF58 domain-containing protein [Actinomycetota bacterium]